ncbi:MAG: nucleotidyl transferase AbiEii/AbiGii toxin family protein [Bacteroidota bacterium]|nr:nucleotidyl transferase AbiEii/AbiGii toxin family protein [Bacteroidota bacterium]
MIDINKHRFYLFQILKQIYSDAEIASLLGFKGGTALMFFYDLPRLSVDLDFNLLDSTKENLVYEKIRNIVLAYGNIHDEVKKFYGPILVLDYGMSERKLKVEISNRNFPDRYEIKNLMGQSIKVMVPEDLLAHKLCALLDRPTLTNRDVFDIWFLLSKKTPVNPKIIEARMQLSLHDYLEQCISTIGDLKTNKLLIGIGDLLDQNMKNFVRNKLKDEVLEYLRFYQKYPITSL